MRSHSGIELRTSYSGIELHVYQLSETDNVGKFVVADQAGWMPGVYDTIDDAVKAWKEANDIS